MPRLTFQYIVAQAAKWGVIVERKGRAIQYYDKYDHSTVGESPTVAEAWDDLNANFFKI